jgi:hypothetical protein
MVFPQPARAEARAARASRPQFGQVLHGTLSTFARHPAPILICALLCFAAVAILGSLLYCVLVLDVFFRTGSYFSATPGIYHLQMQFQAALGTVMYLLGRGAITWIALQAERGAPVTVRGALGAATARWKALLASGLIYGALITLALIGTTWMLRELRLDVSNYRWLRSDTNSIMNMAMVRSIGVLPPDPGSPFSELYAATRYNLSRVTSSYYGWSTYQLAARNLPPEFLLSGLAGIVLLIVTETLLCMRTAAIVRAPAGPALRWLRDVAGVSWRHLWTVAGWRWGVRLGLAVIYAGCLTLPIVLHQSLIVPTIVREVRSYWPYPINTALYGIAAALAGMMVLSFSLIFEARMYVALSDSETA